MTISFLEILSFLVRCPTTYLSRKYVSIYYNATAKSPVSIKMNEDAYWEETSALAALLEVDAGAPDVVEGEFPVVESDDPNGVILTVELFLHWSVGKTVAFLLNVMSAHYFVVKVSRIYKDLWRRSSHCTVLLHQGL